MPPLLKNTRQATHSHPNSLMQEVTGTLRLTYTQLVTSGKLPSSKFPLTTACPSPNEVCLGISNFIGHK